MYTYAKKRPFPESHAHKPGSQEMEPCIERPWLARMPKKFIVAVENATKDPITVFDATTEDGLDLGAERPVGRHLAIA